jgi:malonyl-CoA/methylmalonyl-CoA synthetase
MTEFAMAISNPLQGARKLNSVGVPLPGFHVRLAHESGVEGAALEAPPEGFTAGGEIQVRGDGVFREYWGKPEATAETFTPCGTWFKTGDLGAVDGEGYYYILGRLSADIIKSGGFKISALDVEREVLTCPLVGECAVVGLPDDTWGEKVTAVVTPRGGAGTGGTGGTEEERCAAAALALNSDPAAHAAFFAALKEHLKDKLPPYKIPTLLKVLPAIPRNAMGKVGKKALKLELWPEVMAAAAASKKSSAPSMGSPKGGGVS